jgi:glutaminyl-tRNA synthetase
VAPGGAVCRLRFDDTNPDNCTSEFAAEIERDIAWLGFEPDGVPRRASDYFGELYEFARTLIERGNAYVCELPRSVWSCPEHGYLGTTTRPGRPSPFRDRPAHESLERLERMRRGEEPEGSMVLRAKIDMSSPNMHMRDPVMYRILLGRADDWSIYPSYDFAHGLSDAIEGVTHSLCTLEFEEHRAPYDWFVRRVGELTGRWQMSRADDPDGSSPPRAPEQTEFAPLSLSGAVTSKRWIRALVADGAVSGWDDPRLLTLAGLRRRGVPPRAVRRFCESTGVARAEATTVDAAMLDAEVRRELDAEAPRAMGVLRPLSVVVENFEEAWADFASSRDSVEPQNVGVTCAPTHTTGKIGIEGSRALRLPKHPKRPEMGDRNVPVSRHIYIDKLDFCAGSRPKGFKRLSPDQPVRLRGAFVVRVVDWDACPTTGEVHQVRVRADLGSIGARPDPANGPAPRGVVHWVCAEASAPAEVRLYSPLFVDGCDDPVSAATRDKVPDDGKGTLSRPPMDAAAEEGASALKPFLRPDSLTILNDCRVERSVAESGPGTVFQLEREGYFVVDEDSLSGPQGVLVLGQTVGLRAAK